MESYYYLFQIAIGIVSLVATITLSLLPFISHRKVKRALDLINIYDKAPITASFSSIDIQIYTIMQRQIQESICDAIGYKIDHKEHPPYVRKKPTMLKDALIISGYSTILSIAFTLLDRYIYNADSSTCAIMAVCFFITSLFAALVTRILFTILKNHPKKRWNKIYARTKSEEEFTNKMLAMVKEFDEMKEKNLESESLIKAVRQVLGRS